jgi:diadenosine tetraphosphatase ApaH/serine/threonine PP2A family protein phosphatase
MLADRYGNTLSTTSETARDAYIEGVDCLISANHGAEDAFGRAIAADEGFALAHAGLARTQQIAGQGAKAREAMAAARALAGGVSAREQSHLAALEPLIAGNAGAAFAAICQHLDEHPRDAFLVQPCTSVFGLIGFSGVAGREAEMLAFMHRLMPHYGNDWWFNSLLAFAQVEAGQRDVAVTTIERALADNPRNAHGAHIKAHIHYERGETKAGLAYIDDWRNAYDKAAPLHCHISWHVALWALETGDEDRAWQVIEADVKPDGAWGPPINVLTDTASFLMRAELAGGRHRPELWREISAYAARFFPNPGIAFADVHAALAHAMAGETEAVEKIISDAKGPAADIVKPMAEAFRAVAREDWPDVIARLVPTMAEHERIGGSRAQRDLIEFTLVNALLKNGRGEEAARLLAMRRPQRSAERSVAGLH